jgi:hypothetical protein
LSSLEGRQQPSTIFTPWLLVHSFLKVCVLAENEIGTIFLSGCECCKVTSNNTKYYQPGGLHGVVDGHTLTIENATPKGQTRQTAGTQSRGSRTLHGAMVARLPKGVDGSRALLRAPAAAKRFFFWRDEFWFRDLGMSKACPF